MSRLESEAPLGVNYTSERFDPRERYAMASGPVAPILLLTMTLLSVIRHDASADDRIGTGSQEASGTQREQSQQPGLMPPLPPPEIDPGIQRYPETTPHPESVVPPPQVDPDMAVDPETRKPLKDSPVPQPDPHPGPSDPVPAPPTPAPPAAPKR
jgi:hypothetical protein